MFPTLLITFREVIEASLIVATILSILVKFHESRGIKTVWTATFAATAVSLILLAAGSILGLRVQEVFKGKTEMIFEGVTLVLSSFFITWAVFFLHKYFSVYKAKLLAKIKKTVEKEEETGLFFLVFTAVFREGMEIVLFLSTIYFASNPGQIFMGFFAGAIPALIISLGLFTATLRLPVFYAFRITSALLILFGAGQLIRSMGEFSELGIIPEVGKMTLFFMPKVTSVSGELIQAVFGWSRSMDILQISFYFLYILLLGWWVFVRRAS